MINMRVFGLLVLMLAIPNFTITIAGYCSKEHASEQASNEWIKKTSEEQTLGFKEQAAENEEALLEQRIATVRVLTQNFKVAALAVEASGDIIAEDEKDKLALKEGTRNMNCSGDGRSSWVEKTVLNNAIRYALARDQEVDIASEKFEKAFTQCRARYAHRKFLKKSDAAIGKQW